MDDKIKDQIEFFAMTNDCGSQGVNCDECEFYSLVHCREAFLIKRLIDTGKLKLGD